MEAASALGLKTVHYVHNDQAIADIRSALEGG